MSTVNSFSNNQGGMNDDAGSTNNNNRFGSYSKFGSSFTRLYVDPRLYNPQRNADGNISVIGFNCKKKGHYVWDCRNTVTRRKTNYPKVTNL